MERNKSLFDTIERARKIEKIGESDKAFTRTPLTLEEQAAELAYRRGFHQGVYLAMAHLEGDGTLASLQRYQRQVMNWRFKDGSPVYKKAQAPPMPVTR